MQLCINIKLSVSIQVPLAIFSFLFFLFQNKINKPRTSQQANSFLTYDSFRGQNFIYFFVVWVNLNAEGNKNRMIKRFAFWFGASFIIKRSTNNVCFLNYCWQGWKMMLSETFSQWKSLLKSKLTVAN